MSCNRLALSASAAARAIAARAALRARRRRRISSPLRATGRLPAVFVDDSLRAGRISLVSDFAQYLHVQGRRVRGGARTWLRADSGRAWRLRVEQWFSKSWPTAAGPPARILELSNYVVLNRCTVFLRQLAQKVESLDPSRRACPRVAAFFGSIFVPEMLLRAARRAHRAASAAAQWPRHLCRATPSAPDSTASLSATESRDGSEFSDIDIRVGQIVRAWPIPTPRSSGARRSTSGRRVGRVNRKRPACALCP